MIDRGIQVILNSTVWTKTSHSGAYTAMKQKLGLQGDDESNLAMIINTSMSPWLRAQKSYKRLGCIIRNELYNAYGGVLRFHNLILISIDYFTIIKVYDEPQILKLVSPNLLKDDWNGDLFAELEVIQ